MSALLKLAERCEQGHADYQRTLLSDAAYAVFGDEADHRDDPAFWPKATDFVAKLRAQAYLDAAMTLVPEGSEIDLTNLYGVARAHVDMNSEGGGFHGEHLGGNIPLALCAAALRACAASGTPTRRAETTGSVGEADGGPVPQADAQ